MNQLSRLQTKPITHKTGCFQLRTAGMPLGIANWSKGSYYQGDVESDTG